MTKPVPKSLNPWPPHNHKVQFNNLLFSWKSPEMRVRSSRIVVGKRHQGRWLHEETKINTTKVSDYSVMTKKETECRTGAAHTRMCDANLHLFVSGGFVWHSWLLFRMSSLGRSVLDVLLIWAECLATSTYTRVTETVFDLFWCR